MRIKYQTVEDDYVAFNVFFSRHSPYARRMRIIAGLIVPGLFFILFLSQAIYLHDWTQAFIGIVICGGFALWVLTGRSRRARHIARKIFKEGKNKDFLGIHELEINDYGIVSKSEYSEGKIAWAGIERIASTPDYTFIFTSANKAIPLPKARVIEGDYDAFVAEVTSCFAKFAAIASTTPSIKQATAIVDQKPASCEDRRAGKHSGYGIASFLIALVAMGIIFLAFMAIAISAIIVGGPDKKDNPLFIMSVISFLIAWGAAFVGAGLGIAGLLSKNRKKPFAVVGLILNLLVVFGVVLMMVLARSSS
jgi:MFS family permease